MLYSPLECFSLISSEWQTKRQEKELGVRTRFSVEEDLHLLLGALLEGRGKSTQRLAARLLAMHEWAAGRPLQDVQSSVTAQLHEPIVAVDDRVVDDTRVGQQKVTVYKTAGSAK